MENKNNFTVETQLESLFSALYTIVDKETGVNYVVITTQDGVTMTPRLNADGTLYISKEN